MRRKRSGRKLKLFFRLFVLLFLLILFLLPWWFYRKSWNGNSRFTVVVENVDPKNKPEDYQLAVISIEKERGSGEYLFLRPNFMLDIPYGYKTYPVSSVYKLGQLDKNKGGGYLLKKSIETTLGIKVDRYLLFTSSKSSPIPESSDQLTGYKRANFRFPSGWFYLTQLYSSKVETDMNPLERYRFWNKIRSLRRDQIRFTDLSETSSATIEKLPDKTNVYVLDLSSFDHFIDARFQDVRVRTEQYTLEVQNATGQEKIAAQFSRILDHLGAHVILKTTADKAQKESCLLMFNNSKATKSQIAHILESGYNCQEAINGSKGSQADIKVIIGEGFLK